MPQQEQNRQPAPPAISATNGEKAAVGQKTEETATAGTEGAKIPGIHTLKSDISEYIKKQDISLVDIAASAPGQNRLRKTTQNNKTIIISAAVILIISGIAAGWFLFFRKNEPPGKTQNIKIPPALIFSEKQETITLKSGDKKELINSIRESAESLIALNTVLNVPILLDTKESKEYLNSVHFFEILEIKPPANFLQSLEGNFMFGVFYLKENNPFLVFKIRAFDLAFSGMLAWEKKIADDLKNILLIQAQSPDQKFQDKIVENHDSRILYDAGGAPIIIYSFLNKRYLVVAVDLDTFEEIIRRLATSPLSAILKK